MHLTVPIIYSGALIIYVKCKFYGYFYKFYTRKEIIDLEYKLWVMLGIQLILQPNAYKLTWHSIWK